MTDRLGDWVALVDACYPESDAEGWDATGLQVGDPTDPVDQVLVCLDVTPATLGEAVERGAGLVVAHHPLLFRPLARLTPATAPGRLALAAARGRVGILTAHTNLDVAVAGTSDPGVQVLGLTEVAPLVPAAAREGGCKLVTFVPAEVTAEVLAALAGAGAGRIGEYDECSFRVHGTGTFRPSATADPMVGDRGRRNEVGEDRLEMVVPSGRLAGVVAALRESHPYEEVAYDVLPLLHPPQAGKGLGRVGTLPAPLALRDAADRLVAGLPSPHLRVAGDLDRPVRRVAVCGGAGDSLIGAALRAGADLYVTGDLRHHVTLDALTAGLALIDAGHHATEAAALPAFQQVLAAAAADRGLTGRLLASQVSTDPWVDYPSEPSTRWADDRRRGGGPH
ncbi:MAG: Nif3-like dinuclear metal center hexameric protein [Egibacteraceae bacterium]